MFIQASEGIGQDTIKKNGHEREKWNFCQQSSLDSRKYTCEYWLKVKFRHSFKAFRQEVERAFRRWMNWPRARLLIKKT